MQIKNNHSAYFSCVRVGTPHICYVANDKEYIITRTFNAPRDLVFETITDAELIPEWWGPKVLSTSVEQMDIWPGGIWRFVQYDVDGNEYAFNGAYKEIIPPERLVYTFEYEGMPGHVLTETVTLEEEAGKTKLTDKVEFATAADKEEMMKAGMEKGAKESMDRLTELIKKV